MRSEAEKERVVASAEIALDLLSEEEKGTLKSYFEALSSENIQLGEHAILEEENRVLERTLQMVPGADKVVRRLVLTARTLKAAGRNE